LRYIAAAIVLLIGAFPLSRADSRYPDFIENVYLSEEEAVRRVYPKGTTVKSEERVLTPEEQKRIETRLRWKIAEDRFTIIRGYQDEKSTGYAVITEEIGKFKPITFIVKVSEKGIVERVEVMVYRESRGGEVRRQRFLRQFRKKDSRDPIRINRDIMNVTGATLSVRAMSAGVKKVLVVLEELGYIENRVPEEK